MQASVEVGPENLAGDLAGANFLDLDPAFDWLLGHYLGREAYTALRPRYHELGGLAGGVMADLVRTADRNEPTLVRRDRWGRDEERIEHHPAYRALEEIAYDRFQLHSMGHRPTRMDKSGPVGDVVKYAFHYLFAQAEFGLLCPVSLCDTAVFMVSRYGDEALRQRFLPRMLASHRARMWTSAQLMTEREAGCDVSGIETTAELDSDGHWHISGEKWFCSNADADVILLLARSEADLPGNRGLSLFLVPKHLEDGRRNSYWIEHLKPKLGTRSMPTGEIRFDHTQAFLLGQRGRGLRQTMDQVSMSRLSHGVRAAGQMRRCLNEARAAASSRHAFGRPLEAHPLMQRQVMKIMLPTEQALSAFMFTARALERQKAGDAEGAPLLRLLTPLIKFQACRDNIRVATAAMEVRGGNGFIEDWDNARLVRDSHTGVLWEGPSSIIALDVIRRALPERSVPRVLDRQLKAMLKAAGEMPGDLRHRLRRGWEDALAFANAVAADPMAEAHAREAVGGLYNAVTAILLACEGLAQGQAGGDGRRLLLAQMVLDHRLPGRDPRSLEGLSAERDVTECLLAAGPVGLEAVAALIMNRGS